MSSLAYEQSIRGNSTDLAGGIQVADTTGSENTAPLIEHHEIAGVVTSNGPTPPSNAAAADNTVGPPSNGQPPCYPTPPPTSFNQHSAHHIPSANYSHMDTAVIRAHTPGPYGMMDAQDTQHVPQRPVHSLHPPHTMHASMVQKPLPGHMPPHNAGGYFPCYTRASLHPMHLPSQSTPPSVYPASYPPANKPANMYCVREPMCPRPMNMYSPACTSTPANGCCISPGFPSPTPCLPPPASIQMSNAAGVSNTRPPTTQDECMMPSSFCHSTTVSSISTTVSSMVTSSLSSGVSTVLGPDGTMLDDASQHSTLSNLSINSEEQSRSPKPVGGRISVNHPSVSTTASPYHFYPSHQPDINCVSSADERPSSNWACTPSIGERHNSRDHSSASKKAESLNRLYEIDNSPGRADFISALLNFMQERGTPILQCPTVSKQPLDLFKLYQLTRQRGGFEDVTKSKAWKDIAIAMGIGGSSSGAYTLRKHYMKNLLYYECYFDMNGADARLILDKYQTRAGGTASARSKKTIPSPSGLNATSCATTLNSSVSSPSNHDSYSNSGSLDGYPSNYPAYPNMSNCVSDFSNGIVSMPNSCIPAPSQAYASHPSYDISSMQQQQLQSSQQPAYYHQYPSASHPTESVTVPGTYAAPDTHNSMMWHSSYSRAAYNTVPVRYSYVPVPPHHQQPPHHQPLQHQQPPHQPLQHQQPPPHQPLQHQQPPPHQPLQHQQPPHQPLQHQQPPQHQPLQHQQPPQHQLSQHHQPSSINLMPPTHVPHMLSSSTQPASTVPSVGLRPSAPVLSAASSPAGDMGAHSNYDSSALSHHVDHLPVTTAYQLHHSALHQTSSNVKSAGYNSSSTLARQLASPVVLHAPLGNSSHVRPGPPYNAIPSANGPQFVQNSPQPMHRPAVVNHDWRSSVPMYSSFQSHMQSSAQPSMVAAPSVPQHVSAQPGWNTQSSAWAARPSTFRPVDKMGYAHTNQQQVYLNNKLYNPNQQPVRQFPPDSVEAVTPLLVKRRRLVRCDVTPCDGWRLVCALRSGLLAETRVALDTLLALTFDDTCVSWMSLSHMPGLFSALLHHLSARLGLQCDPDPWLHLIDPIQYDSFRHKPGHRVETNTRRDLAPKEEKASPENDVFSSDLDGFATDVDFFLKRLRKYTRFMNDTASGAPSAAKAASESSSTCATTDDEALSRTCETHNVFGKCLSIRDPDGVLLKERCSHSDELNLTSDEINERCDLLCSSTDSSMSRAHTLLALTTIIRNFSFVPGNPSEMLSASHSKILLPILHELVLINHSHTSIRRKKSTSGDSSFPVWSRDTKSITDNKNSLEHSDSCDISAQVRNDDQLAPYTSVLQENSMVTLCNLAPELKLENFDQQLLLPLVSGILHWLTCMSSEARDIFPHLANTCSSLSPQRLAMETLLRLCIDPDNVDIILATPSPSTLPSIINLLASFCVISHPEHPTVATSSQHPVPLTDDEMTVREMAINILYYLTICDEHVCVLLAKDRVFVGSILSFIEAAEAKALSLAQNSQIVQLRNEPELIGTSLETLARSAKLLVQLSHTEQLCRHLPVGCDVETRLLTLVMSQILDQRVAATLSIALHNVSRTSVALVSS